MTIPKENRIEPVNNTQVKPEIAEPLLYTVAAVSKKLSLGVSTLYRMMDEGTIRYHRIGRTTRRISKDEIHRFLRETQV